MRQPVEGKRANMKTPFEHSSSYWVRYDRYECRRAADGHEYVISATDAQPRPYDPMRDAEQLVVDALNVGMLCLYDAEPARIRQAVMDFVSHYGLLGLMTAIPTTPMFMEYESVYLLKNQFIRDEVMDTEAYLSLFQPFRKLRIVKRGKESRWNLTDKTMIALAMTFREKPMAQQMCFMREYGERYDWLTAQFRDWAFAFCSSFLYYEDYDTLDEDTRELYRLGMAAFDGIAPSYHIKLREKPTLVWDFHSLLLAIQMLFSFMLTDERSTLRLCPNCKKVFPANRPNMVFCSAACRCAYNEKRRTEDKD